MSEFMAIIIAQLNVLDAANFYFYVSMCAYLHIIRVSVHIQISS